MKIIKKSILLSLLLILFLAGCIPSVHPLYTQKDLIFDTQVIGTWEDQEGNLWKFSQKKTQRGENKKSYLLTRYENDKAKFLDVHLLKLGGKFYFDFYPEEVPLDVQLFPVHTFARFSKKGKNTIQIEQFDADYIGELITKKKVKIKHEQTEDNILLTANTEELQKFVIKYSKDKKLFEGNVINLKRKR
ncbi:hypothetical protein [Xanthovirga aplysinae]|uniref:hypothetical protein n=1 Tax=Xanthovirga aplysinae TaxID=2529853 RepID=UPI0012BC44EC|nr:hypothetical protein [Xanthovirga aplysinae]MTI31500.1 hypothetical protein [Xanthovirga aplysinae]